MNRIYPLVSFSFLFISFHFFSFLFTLYSFSISFPLYLGLFLLFPHCLHLASLSHYFISISLSISISSNSKVLSIHCLGSLISYLLSSIHCLLSLILYPLPWFSYPISIALVLLSLFIVSDLTLFILFILLSYLLSHKAYL